MQNLIFHISLPKGIKLVNGATLMKDVTFDFISQITPYYSTIDMVRLAAGPTLKKLSDITIACQIYRSSNEADLITAARVPLSGLQHTRLIGSRLAVRDGPGLPRSDVERSLAAGPRRSCAGKLLRRSQGGQ